MTRPIVSATAAARTNFILTEADLIPTLLSLSTIRLSYGMLATSLQQLATYISRFRTRLSGKHLVHLKRLLVFLDALKKYVIEWKEAKVAKPGSDDQNTVEVMTIPEFMDHLGRKASGINLLEIENYLKTSKVYYWSFNEISLMPNFYEVARKISGYADKQAEKEAGLSLTLQPFTRIKDSCLRERT